MIDLINKIISKIENKIDETNFNLEIEEEIEELKSIQNISINVVNKILYIFEKHPNFDFGSPGELVHYLESFYKNGYENKLVDSIQRSPTEHTLWMLNRIINGTTESEEKDNYLNLLENIYSDKSIAQNIRSTARRFYDLHQ